MKKICWRGLSDAIAVVAAMLLIGVAASMAQEGGLSDSQSSATPKKIKVSRRDIDFGQVTAPKVETTTVSNPGSQSVTVSISPLAAPFSLTGSSTVTLGPKSSETIGVRFAPQAKGRFRDSLTVSGNAKPVQVTLKGQGRGPFPVITSITVEPQPVVTTATLSAIASDPAGGPLTYTWAVGGVQVASGADAVWNSPGIPGEYLVGLTVTNSQGAIATATASMMVSSQSPWPRFRRTIQATGLSAVDTSADTGNVEWVFTTSSPSGPSEFLSSPTIGSDGTIYASNTDGDFYALNPNGTQKWKTSIGGNSNFNSPAIVADGTIYVGTGTTTLGSEDSGNFYALDPDGSQKWKFPTVGIIVSSPAIGSDGTIYFASNSGTFYALNPDGTQKWNFTPTPLTRQPVSTPAIGTDGTIYVGYSAPGKGPPFPPNSLIVYYALNPNGTQKWQTDITVPGLFTLASPAIGSDGTIYVTSGGNFVAINPDGTQRWSGGGSSNTFTGSPAIGADGTIYDGTTSFMSIIGGSFFAFNPSGSVKWIFNGPSTCCVGGFGDSAIGADGTVYLGGLQGIGSHFVPYLYALNPDGSQRWRVAGPGAAPAIGADGTLYVAIDSLYAIH